MMYSRAFLRWVNAACEVVLKAAGSLGTKALAPLGLPGQKRRVLLVKLVGMGDAVLVRSLAEHLQAMHPELEIGVLAGPATYDVLGSNPRFTGHLYDPAGADRGILKGLRKLREIRKRSYDVVVDFEQHILLIALFLWLIGIPDRVGLAAADNPRSRFQTVTVRLFDQDSMWGAYQALLRIIEPSLGEVSTVPLPRSARVIGETERWWKAHRLHECQLVVAMHLGCGSRAVARRWPVARFVRLAERMTAARQSDAVVLTGTRDEQGLVEEFMAAFGGHVVDATGLPSVEHTAEVVRRCRLMISNDTGTMHLAAAMGTPTVGLFGPNSPARYAPVGPHAVSVYATSIPCSPCIHIHRGIVPECFADEKGRCLLDIDVETVFAAAQRVLGRVDPEGAIHSSVVRASR